MLSFARNNCARLTIHGSRAFRTSCVRADEKVFSPSTYTAVEELSTNRINERLSRSVLHEFPIAEQKARIELAACYRLFDHFQWNDDVINHLTVAVHEPDGTKSFLINPYGLRYDEITASSLLKIDSQGGLKHPGVVGDIFKVNRAGFVIHSAIHNCGHESAEAVLHCHHPVITGLASTKDGYISPLSQTSSIIGEPGYHDFEGIVVDEAEKASLVQNLGDKNVLLLRNHGVITTGATIGGAWYRMYMLIRSAELQATAQASASSGGGLNMPNPEAAHQAFETAKTFTGRALGTMEFSAYMRLMDKVDSSFRL
ncbi:hypothetical protein MYAM1_002270 [Malassezia yamatoensis]|uniref:Class II aldolase/adducin N-terminal domain-containing protein n=1 Tax=Malassezia yamatoensis TaxID=253288 RepID=A0AAJ5YSS7_9BASI|nr:hypothetical protein MYAM1_002270 [Malassezia yamatoensis]